MCIWLPHLAADRARHDAPRSDHVEGSNPRALALTRPVGASLRIESVCPHAAALGVGVGMTLGQALAIAPGLRAEPSDSTLDRQAIERLADWATRFSPTVEIAGVDALLLDVTGCGPLFRGEPNLARRAHEGLQQNGFHTRVAIADTIGAAWAICVAADEPVFIAPPGESVACLAGLPPTALRIDEKTADRLWQVGIRCIGDLLMIPWSQLPARFGPHVVLRLQQALGEVCEPFTPHTPHNPPAAEALFELPVTELPPIQSVAEDLLERVCAALLLRDLAARRLDCALIFDRAVPQVVRVGLSRASRQRGHMLELLRQRLERIDPSAGVCGVRLTASETERWRAEQGELLEPMSGVDGPEFARLLDLLANRLGHEAVVRSLPADEHLPEAAYRYVSTAETGLPPEAPGDAGAGGRREYGSRAGEAGPSLPARLLPEPLQIRAISNAVDGPPTWMLVRGREYIVTEAIGPRRIETGWWRGPDVRRDYFCVTTESGERFWVFRSGVDHRWRLHGVFE